MNAGDGAHTAVFADGSGEGPRESPETFGDRLSELVERRESQLVLGLDPDPARLWPRAIELAGGAGNPPAPPATRAAMAAVIHCSLAIAAAGDYCVAVKPQVACFERLGAPGWAALGEVVQRAHEAGLLVLADAKRGDIDISAKAYAQAFFGETPTVYGPVPGLGVDALTANPLLGGETLMPLIEAARQVGGGVFTLVRTSNPGSADVQELELADGGTVSERVARLVAALGEPGIGSSGLADVCAVVGATAPGRLERMRELMPHTTFLLPGVGPQGGRIEDLAAAFEPGPAGGLVSASRGIIYAFEQAGSGSRDPEDAARREAARLRELAWGLAG